METTCLQPGYRHAGLLPESRPTYDSGQFRGQSITRETPQNWRINQDFAPMQDLPLGHRNIEPVLRLCLNDPNVLNEELAAVKERTTGALLTFINQIETLSECIRQSRSESSLPFARQSAEKQMNSLVADAFFPLYQQLNIAVYQHPSPREFLCYLATGEHPKHCNTRPLLATVCDLCKKYPELTLGQLMDKLDSEPVTAHSEAVQALLRFRDNHFDGKKESSVKSRKRPLTDSSAPEQSPREVAKTEPSTISANSGKHNRKPGPDLWNNPGTTIGLTGLTLASMFTGGAGGSTYKQVMIGYRDPSNAGFGWDIEALCNSLDQQGSWGVFEPFGTGNNQTSELCSEFCITKLSGNTRYTSDPSWSPLLDSGRCNAAASIMKKIFQVDTAEGLYNCTTNYSKGERRGKKRLSADTHHCLYTYARDECSSLNRNATDPADSKFCRLCDAASDPGLRCTPLPRAEPVSRFYNANKTANYTLAEACQQEELPELCDHFCISDSPSEQSRYQTRWAEKLGDQCARAKSEMNELIDMNRATEEFDCQVFDVDNELHFYPDSGQCLYDYAVDECKALVNNGTSASDGHSFCQLCNAAKDTNLRCDPPFRTDIVVGAAVPAAIISLSYLGYQWYQGYRENGLSLSMLTRPFLPKTVARPDNLKADDDNPPPGETTSFLPTTRSRPDALSATTKGSRKTLKGTTAGADLTNQIPLQPLGGGSGRSSTAQSDYSRRS